VRKKHSAICTPHFKCPPGPRNETGLMVFALNALARRTGQRLKFKGGLTPTCQKGMVGEGEVNMSMSNMSIDTGTHL